MRQAFCVSEHGRRRVRAGFHSKGDRRRGPAFRCVKYIR
jgi:hypothetical protein